jgi:hypothetical protein
MLLVVVLKMLMSMADYLSLYEKRKEHFVVDLAPDKELVVVHSNSVE